MELESDDGTTRIPLEAPTITEIGRNLNFSSDDRTISRRHLVVHPHHSPASQKGETPDSDGKIGFSFEVIGKNPILVVDGNGGEKRRLFRSGEEGELREGDAFSLSIKNPRFFLVKKIRCEEKGEVDVEVGVLDVVRRREERTLRRRKEEDKEEERKLGEKKSCTTGRDEGEEGSALGMKFGFETLDLSRIDPVKEFGFLVRGHEFDDYPRQKHCAVKDWNWYLDEHNGASEDEDDEKVNRRKKGKMGKRRKGEENEDEEWTGESEEENNLVTSCQSAKRSKYSTRSKDPKEQQKDGISGSKQTKPTSSVKDETDEDDPSLGGFIVDNDDEEQEESKVEEEEFDDDGEEDE